MLRAVLAATGTVAGLAALFTFKTHAPGLAPIAEPSSPAALTSSAPSAGASPSASVSTSGAKKPAASPSAARTTAPAMTQPTTQGTTPATKAPSTTPTSAKPSSTPTKKASATPTPTATKTTAPTTQQFEGPNVDTQYGPVQVVITVSGGKITAANDAQQAADSIGANAIPQLNQEVLTAQSANIQAVSGATFTSNGYIQSLQQAVDQAGL
jgi:uncharacterized protein with FMN-binding domain